MALTNLVSNQGYQVIGASGLPVYVPSSGSIGTNGALTGITALLYNPGSCYMHFPAGALFTGSADGFYYTIMSSTTVGTVFNNPIATSGVPCAPAVLVPIVGAGPGAYVQVVTAQTAITLPLPNLGPHGVIKCTQLYTNNNNANAKTTTTAINGNSVFVAAPTTNTSQSSTQTIFGRGQQAIGVVTINANVGLPSFGGSATTPTGTSSNLAANSTLTYSIQLANAGDWSGIEGFLVEAIASAVITTS